MARNAGPAGSGLIPPALGSRDDDDTRDDRNQDEDLPDLDDIDGVPPVMDEDDDEDLDDGGSGDVVDVDELERRIEQRLEQKFQSRFDRAVSKARRNLERQYSARETTREEPEDDDDDEAGSPPPKKRRRSSGQVRNVDVTSIRLLARDMVSDQMNKSGSQERAVVKSVLDVVLPMVDWDKADEDDFVAELVEKLSGASAELVKTGSDRKLTQLRRMGVVPDRQGQPASSQSSNGKGSLEKAMRKGASAAAERFPEGTRRLLR